ncbi:MAG: hypothetical protein IPH36_13530 [Saprospiraceae bacterium]|nr:hypothetical protein [Saprospiraceae bacterium]
MIFSPLHAQYIKGKISDKDGLPLAGAHIKVLASSLGTTSDWEGGFNCSWMVLYLIALRFQLCHFKA